MTGGSTPRNSLMVMGPEDILKAVIPKVCCEIVCLHIMSTSSLAPYAR